MSDVVERVARAIWNVAHPSATGQDWAVVLGGIRKGRPCLAGEATMAAARDAIAAMFEEATDEMAAQGLMCLNMPLRAGEARLMKDAYVAMGRAALAKVEPHP